MICPKDHQPMLAIEYNGVEIDFCPECEGIWLDSGELEFLAASGNEASPWLSSFSVAKDVSEKKVKCPRCQSKMDKVRSNLFLHVVIDSCRLGDGFWFDKGELQRILERVSDEDKQDKVLAFLNDVFGVQSG